MIRRTQSKRDANHGEISEVFRSLGFTVLDISAVGGGCPDIVVGRRGYNWLIEIKDGSKPPSARKRTVDELTFAVHWNGQVKVISSRDEAIKFETDIRELGA